MKTLAPLKLCIVLLLTALPSVVTAQTTDASSVSPKKTVTPPDTSESYAKHGWYAQWVTMGLVNNLSLNYEFRFAKHFTVSAGGGFGLIIDSPVYAGESMFHFLIGGDERFFEVGLGAAVAYSNNYNPSDDKDQKVDKGVRIVPACALNYRYHARNGMIFRAGLALSYLSAPLMLSVGTTF